MGSLCDRYRTACHGCGGLFAAIAALLAVSVILKMDDILYSWGVDSYTLLHL